MPTGTPQTVHDIVTVEDVPPGTSEPRTEAEASTGPRLRDYVTLLLAVLMIKALVLGWGVAQARPEKLSHHDYRNNYHHH